MRNQIGTALLALLTALALSACQGGNNGASPEQANPPAASPTGTAAEPGGTVAAADAEALYKSKCVACHAADLRGGAGPNLQSVGAKLSAEDIAAKIANGGGGMPAYEGKLTQAEIQALTDWLAAKKG